MALFNLGEKAYLMLENGRIFEGCSVGAKGVAFGETVFTTGMTGYVETLTDPGHYGQIVVQTFPLIGNYGVNRSDYQSEKPVLSGYVIREWCGSPSNFRSENSIEEFLLRHNIVGIHSIDTRSLTREIRECGVMNGVIATDDVYANKDKLLEELKKYKTDISKHTVSVSEKQFFKSDNPVYNAVIIDFGYRSYIRDELLKRGCNVTVLPYDVPAGDIAGMNPDGIILSNGPGDPALYTGISDNIKELYKLRIPMFGISLGHQLMAAACGAAVSKLKYGHRGANQPVYDAARGKTFITSQNHGYAVDGIDESAGIISYKNANDGTCEGIRYKSLPCFSVQFHPVSNGGPQNTVRLFDEFIAMIKNLRGNLGTVEK